MKKIINVIAITLCVVMGAYAQSKKGFVLEGSIEGLKNGSIIYLTTHEGDTLTKAISNGASFTLKGYVDGESDYYFLRMDDTAHEIDKDKSLVSNALWLVNGRISVKGKLTELGSLVLSGSKPQKDWERYKVIWDKKSKISESDWKIIHNQFIDTHLNSPFTPHIITVIDQNLKEFHNRLGVNAKKSYWGVKLEKIIKQRDIAASIKSSDKMPSFDVTTAEGEKKSILNLISSSKYTIIDFWASWCAPCRASIPNLRKTYDAFHTKGFNIIGVSTDKNEAAWRKAMMEDNTPWVHVLDNIDNACKNIFDIVAIPAYMLIDQQGKIIHKDYYSSSSKTQVLKANEKTLGRNLYEIIEGLLKEGKSK